MTSRFGRIHLILCFLCHLALILPHKVEIGQYLQNELVRNTMKPYSCLCSRLNPPYRRAVPHPLPFSYMLPSSERYFPIWVKFEKMLKKKLYFCYHQSEMHGANGIDLLNEHR